MLTIACIILVSTGLIFIIGGTIGILRLPDFYTRLHAAGMIDAMGLVLAFSGLFLYVIQEFTLSALLAGFKIILIILFIYLTSPTATHAIVDAGVRAGKRPWLNPHPMQQSPLRKEEEE